MLSGDTRTYELDLTGKECSNLATVRFEMQTDIGSKPEESLIKREFTPITSGGCK